MRQDLACLVPSSLCRRQEGSQGTNELEPAKREGEQAVERAHEGELLLEPTGLVEPPEQVEQGIDIAGQVRRVEQPALGCVAKQPFGVLDSPRNRLRACLELLDRGER